MYQIIQVSMLIYNRIIDNHRPIFTIFLNSNLETYLINSSDHQDLE